MLESRGKSANEVFAAEEHGRRHLHEIVERSPGPDEAPRDLADDGFLLGRIRQDPQLSREEAHPEEDEPEERAHEDDDRLRVPRFWRLERGHAIRDSLDAGQRDGA